MIGKRWVTQCRRVGREVVATWQRHLFPPRPTIRTSLVGRRSVQNTCPKQPGSIERPRLDDLATPGWVTIPPLAAAPSRGAVGHDRVAGWVTPRAPLKRNLSIQKSATFFCCDAS
jgi:hypothetical protein